MPPRPLRGRQSPRRARPRVRGPLPAAPARRLLYAYYRVGNHHDAEDLTEQAFLQAYRHWNAPGGSPTGPLPPWLIRIAHNLASNYYRDRARKPTAALDAGRPSHRTAPSGWSRAGGAARGDRQARRAEDRREALIMRFALGMSNREIARALGRTDGSDEGPDPQGDQAARGLTATTSRRRAATRAPARRRTAADRAARGPPLTCAGDPGDDRRARAAEPRAGPTSSPEARGAARPAQLGPSGGRGGGRRRAAGALLVAGAPAAATLRSRDTAERLLREIR